MRSMYEIEIVNWIWNDVKTRRDRLYFATNGHPRIKRFATQREAREWLEGNGFEQMFRSSKRPVMYRSGRDRYGYSGMQARIVRVGSGELLGSELAMSRRAARSIR